MTWIELESGGLHGGSNMDSVKISIHTPDGWALDASHVNQRILGLWRGEQRTKSAPHLMISPVRYTEPLKHLDEVISLYREHMQDHLRIVDSSIRVHGDISYARIEIADDLLSKRTLSLSRIDHGNLWVIGCKEVDLESLEWLEPAAISVMRDLIIHMPAARETLGAGWVENHASGFALPIPAGWERQDVAGMAHLFGPGRGFRPRISCDLDGARSLGTTDTAIERILKGLALVLHNPIYDEFNAIHLADINGMEIRFSGIVMKTERQAKGSVMLISRGDRGTVLQMMAAPGRSFETAYTKFTDAVKTMRWF